MICCEGRYSSFRQLLCYIWLSDLCMHILYPEYIFISLVTTVLLGCVLRGYLYLHYPTGGHRFGTQPPKLHSAESTFLLSSGFTPHGVMTAWAQVPWIHPIHPEYREYLQYIQSTANTSNTSRVPRIYPIHPVYREYVQYIQGTANPYITFRVLRIYPIHPEYRESLQYV